MIKYFAVENFKSIKNEAILEFDQYLGKDYPYPSSSIIGVAGANASGKTCILQALTFVLWFMQHSFLELPEDGDIPYTSFIGNEASPTNFYLIFSIKQLIEQEEKWVDYEYNLTLLSNTLLKEELYSYPYKRKRKIYSREERKVNYGRREDIKPLDQEILDNLRDNCSFISFASQFATQKFAQDIQNYKVISNVSSSSQGMKEHEFKGHIVESLIDNSDSLLKLKSLFKIADIGIEDVSLSPRNLKDIKSRLNSLQQFDLETSSETDEDESTKIQSFMDKMRTALLEFMEFEELFEKIQSRFSLVKFKHKIDNKIIEFPDSSESSGTLQFLILLERILRSLKIGGVLIIDEIELKLHQNLVAYLIGLFQNREENPHGAQLIFSFHNTSLMKILEPHQLYFTEKNDQGQTEIFSAADFTDIKDLYKRNLEELYRIGRFGAKPRGI